jgi:hypothetical protein
MAVSLLVGKQQHYAVISECRSAFAASQESVCDGWGVLDMLFVVDLAGLPALCRAMPLQQGWYTASARWGCMTCRTVLAMLTQGPVQDVRLVAELSPILPSCV